MSGYVKFTLIVAGIVAILTFGVSIPANLLGTSLFRSALAFVFFSAVSLGARWVFHRFPSEKAEVEAESSESHAGQQIDLTTPEETVLYDDIFSSPERTAEKPSSFEPLSAPRLDAEQMADVIRKQSLERNGR